MAPNPHHENDHINAALQNLHDRVNESFQKKVRQPPIWLVWFWIFIIRILIIIIVIIVHLPTPSSPRDLPFHGELKALADDVNNVKGPEED
jgi:hypothetical protein